MSATLPLLLNFLPATNAYQQKNQAPSLMNMGDLTMINIPSRKNTIFFRR
jgi:hypothetical protein